MFKHIMHAIVLVGLGSSLAACGGTPALAPAPAPAPVVVTAKGNWTGTVKEGNTSFTTSGVFSDLDGTLAGSLTICPSECVTSSSLTGTRSGTNVSITANYPGGPVNLNASISGNNMSGTITVDGTAGQLTLNRN